MHVLKGLAVFAVSFLMLAQAAQAAYPDKPIRLVVGSAAGSGPDIIARLMSERLHAAWGQRVVVDPRPGVAGLLSADIVQRAAPDGYTWMMLTSQLFIATSVFSNHKINLARDFSSVIFIGSVPFVVSAHPAVAKTLPDLIETARKSPGSIRYGSAGAGGAEHLSAFLLGHLTKTQMVHVPYKGIPQALAETASREVHFSNAVLPVALPQVQGGRVRALGVTTRKRAALLPDVPTVAEHVPGYEMFGWYSLVAPSGTPPAILDKVNAEVARIIKEPAVIDQLKNIGVEITGGSRADLDAFRADQTRRNLELVKLSGVEVK
ncbi:MAG: ABC transporter substrate-binding protein [Betaproteobacteria bacterium]|nr:ABC transporter substrate-binding protein [Betaproteobacteria bacterium]